MTLRSFSSPPGCERSARLPLKYGPSASTRSSGIVIGLDESEVAIGFGAAVAVAVALGDVFGGSSQPQASARKMQRVGRGASMTRQSSRKVRGQVPQRDS